MRHLRRLAVTFLVTVACASLAFPASSAGGALVHVVVQTPTGSPVVAKATSSGWTLLVGNAAILGLPEAADCDDFRPSSTAFLAPDATWPATSNSATAGQCAAAVEMDSSIAGLSFVELRSTGDVGGSVHISGPAGWLVLACGPATSSVIVGAPDVPWTSTQTCTFSAPAPSSFTTWWGYVQNDNSFGDTYGAAA